MLSELYFPFSVIGSTETKIKDNQQPLLHVNIDLPGYSFVSQPTLSNAGGVGFYIKNDLNFTIISELSTSTRGGGGTPLYKVYRYVPPQRVWFLSRFGLKLGMVIGGTFTKAYKIIFLPSNRGE